MALTTAQLTILKADIQANSDLNVNPSNSDGDLAIALLYNVNASPAYWVWKTSASGKVIMGDAGFDWTRVDNLSVGKARIWEWMLMSGTIDPSQANIRAGMAACFSAVGDAATLTAILTECRRNATRAEKIFAVATVGGNGVRGSTANPDTMGFEGFITSQDVNSARNM